MQTPEPSSISLGVILASVRQQRRGEGFARWAMAAFAGYDGVHAELVDLRDWPIPAYDHPTTTPAAEKTYADGSLAKRWSDKIAALDGFVIVTPEYNYAYPGQLKNAIDQINVPWNYKPVAFVGYGGFSAGTRAVQQLRQVMIELRMIPIRDEVSLRLIGLSADDRGWPTDDLNAKRLATMAAELVWWARIAKAARAQRPG